jgi:hypothetical protein
MPRFVGPSLKALTLVMPWQLPMVARAARVASVDKSCILSTYRLLLLSKQKRFPQNIYEVRTDPPAVLMAESVIDKDFNSVSRVDLSKLLFAIPPDPFFSRY